VESAVGTVQPVGPKDAAKAQVSFMSDRGAVPNQSPKRRSQR
jgi:hypothetical protein